MLERYFLIMLKRVNLLNKVVRLQSYLIFIYAALVLGVVALLAWLALRFPFPKVSATQQISSMELATMDQNTMEMDR